MFDFQGVTSYSLGDFSAEKRKSDTAVNAREKPPPGSQVATRELWNQQDYSTFQFQTSLPPAVQPPPQLPKLPNLPSFLNTSFLQTINGNFERVASQIVSFFFGNRKEKPTDDEKQKRGLNDFFTLDFLGERKVEEPSQSGFGDGSS